MLVADKAKPSTLTSSHSSFWSVLLPKDLSEEVLAPMASLGSRDIPQAASRESLKIHVLS